LRLERESSEQHQCRNSQDDDDDCTFHCVSLRNRNVLSVGNRRQRCSDRDHKVEVALSVQLTL
jgi:hypothetical protein